MSDPSSSRHNEAKQILQVSELARQARLLLEERFQLIWVEGEISNLAQPRSGHWYFTLKDPDAQIRCAMFAGRNRSVRFPVKNGLQVLLRGRISLYEARGDFQIIAEHLEPAGEGALRAAYEVLKLKLDAAGLFAAERKRPLPALPRRIAVISSITGAALRDFLQIVERRFAALEIVVLPVAVQGDQAGPEIVAALAALPATNCDLAVLTRGGGSLEDLWAFNLESVAEAIAAAPIPVVSAVGHQTDFTIADFVADVRAPTPSAAAELITPDSTELQSRLATAQARLHRQLTAQLRWWQRQVSHGRSALVDPRARLRQQMQRADEQERRLQIAQQRQLGQWQTQLQALRHRLSQRTPGEALNQAQEALSEQVRRLRQCQRSGLQEAALKLAGSTRTLNAVSPLQTLERGYAALLDADRRVVDSATNVDPGSKLHAYLRDGRLAVTVTAVDLDHPLTEIK